MFEFVFKMFGEGNAALPAKGMGAISKQLAEGLEKDELVLNEKIINIEGNSVHGLSGSTYTASAILIATNAVEIPSPYKTEVQQKGKSALTVYFCSHSKTIATQRIALNSIQGQLITNISFIDHIAPTYAPAGKSLISVSVHTTKEMSKVDLETSIKSELKQWYPESRDWEYLAHYAISYALPRDEGVRDRSNPSDVQLSDTLFICGDHLLNGSINAAMESGKTAVSAILASNLFNPSTA